MVLDLALQHGLKKPASPGFPVDQYCTADMKPPANVGPKLPGSHPNQCRLPVSIAQALKESCDIQTKDFAIIYVNERGNVHYKASPAISLRLPELFSEEFCQKFLNIIDQEHGSRARAGPHGKGGIKDNHREAKRAEQGSAPRPTGKRQKRLASEPEPTGSRPKLSDASYSFSASPEEDDDPSDPDVFEGAGEMMTNFRIDDEEALINFYKTRFLQMQQIPCKVVNKAWVKVVQPKKQARHPYNGGRKAVEAGDAGNGELTKPDWWPPEGTRHREPDHIQKPERLTLLLHILRNLYDYQGTDGRQVRVEELQQSTKDCFADEPKFQKANEWLVSIYSVRKMEERYLRGEIDGTTKLSINMPDKEPKEIMKRSKAKAKARVKRRKHTSSSTLNTVSKQDTIPQKVVLEHRQQSPTDLSSPLAHLDVRAFKQEPSVDGGKSFASSLDGFHTLNQAAIQFRQPVQPTDGRATFSYSSGDYPLRRRSETQSISHVPLYAPRSCQDDSNLSFIPNSVNTFPVPEGSAAKQGQRPSDMYTHDAGTWHSPSLTQSFGSQQEWSYAPPMIIPQQSAPPFATSTPTENQPILVSTPSLAQISPTSPYVLAGPQYFPQDLALTSFGNISTTHANQGHSQGPDLRMIGSYPSFADG